MLDHYLEVLTRKPGALAGSTRCWGARSSGGFTVVHQRFWDAARHSLGNGEGTRALVGVLRVTRTLRPPVLRPGLSPNRLPGTELNHPGAPSTATARGSATTRAHRLRVHRLRTAAHRRRPPRTGRPGIGCGRRRCRVSWRAPRGWTRWGTRSGRRRSTRCRPGSCVCPSTKGGGRSRCGRRPGRWVVCARSSPTLPRCARRRYPTRRGHQRPRPGWRRHGRAVTGREHLR